jgi:tetratricopeptide (TPR) repeat protein
MFAVALGSAMAPAFSSNYANGVLLHLQAGKDALDKKDYEKAKRELEGAVEADPGCTDALNNLGVAWLRTGDFNRAKEYFKGALHYEPTFVPSLNNLAEIYYMEGDYANAVKFYKLALPLAKYRVFELHTNLANALRDKNEMVEAKNHYLTAIRLQPDYPQAYNGYAKLCLAVRNFDMAHDMAVKAIKLSPDYSMAYYHLGLIESARHNRHEALMAYLLSLQSETNPEYAQETRGLISALRLPSNEVSTSELKAYREHLIRGTGEWTTAINRPPITSFIHPSALGDPKPKIEDINQLISQRKFLAAQRELDNLLKPPAAQDPVLINDLGLTYAGLKQEDKAYTLYKKALRLSNDKCYSAFYNLGQLYRLRGDSDTAEKYFWAAINSARRQNKTCPLAQNSLGVLLKQKGDLEAAEAAYKRAISQSGNDLPVVHYNYAILLEKTEHTREAVHEYQAYLLLAPTGANVKEAHARLRRLGVDS